MSTASRHWISLSNVDILVRRKWHLSGRSAFKNYNKSLVDGCLLIGTWQNNWVVDFYTYHLISLTSWVFLQLTPSSHRPLNVSLPRGYRRIIDLSSTAGLPERSRICTNKKALHYDAYRPLRWPPLDVSTRGVTSSRDIPFWPFWGVSGISTPGRDLGPSIPTPRRDLGPGIAP